MKRTMHSSVVVTVFTLGFVFRSHALKNNSIALIPEKHPPPSWLPYWERVRDSMLPRILVWDPSLTTLTAEFDTGYGTRRFRNGPRYAMCTPNEKTVHICEVTQERNRTRDSDAVLIHGDTVRVSDLPKYRANGQFWVFWVFEHRPRVGWPGAFSKIWAAFNWTMARRYDADVVVPAKAWHCAPTKPSCPVPAGPTAKGQAAWILTDCEILRYQERTRSHDAANSSQSAPAIRVQLLLSCGSELCGTLEDCVRYVAQRFRFIIVSWQSDCFQSAYDVIYEAFKYDLVPVVLVPSANVSLQLPPNSVVNTAEMRHPDQLASFLARLLENPLLYSRYFAWKLSCTLAPRADGLCALCNKLWQKPLKRQRNLNVFLWWSLRRDCRQTPFELLRDMLVVKD